MAAFTAVCNSLLLALANYAGTSTDSTELLTYTGQLLSPFIVLFLCRLYAKFDDPPELTRRLSALNAGIKACERDLKDKSCSDDFRVKTLATLDDFKLQRQRLKIDYEQLNSYKPSADSLSGPTDQ